MADSLTAIQEFIKPQVGGSAGTWGGKLNGTADSTDNLLSVPRIQRQVLSDGSVTMVVSAGTVGKLTLTQNTTIAFSGFAADTTPFKPSQRVLLQITGNGAATLALTGVTFLSGAAPAVLGGGVVHYFEVFTVDNGTTKYCVHHGVVDSLPNLFVTGAMIADATIANGKLVDGTLLTGKIADRAVTHAKVATFLVFLTNSASQACAGGTGTTLSFDGENYDPQGFHTPGNPTKIIVPVGGAGVYRIWGVINYDGTSGDNGGVRLEIHKNGTAIARNRVWTEIEAQPEGVSVEAWDPSAAEAAEYTLVVDLDGVSISVLGGINLQFGAERVA